MKNQKIIFTLISLIIMLSAIASITGIFSSDGFKSFTFESIHGEETIVYGKGLYGYMPEDVAVQDIAQDYVTLFVGIPLLIIGMYFSSKVPSRAGSYLQELLVIFLLRIFSTC